MHYLQLIRYKNLLFIAFIQIIVFYAIIVPILQKFGFDASQPFFPIGMLIISTVFIAAGGYVLNDYFDVKIDAINKPDKQIVGKQISRNTAAILHQVLSAIGIVVGLALSVYLKSFTLGFIFIAVPGLLWFYSASYKRQLITGNLIVAFISGLTVLITALTEVSFLNKTYYSLVSETVIPHNIYVWTGGISIFSFLFTWIREIIKDIEDEKGDREMECRTMPIVWGIKKTKIILYVFIVITNLALYAAEYLLIPFEGSLTLRYIIFGLTLPSIALIYLLLKAEKPEDYHTASDLTKVIMLIGLLYAFVFYYLMAKQFGFSIFNLFIIR